MTSASNLPLVATSRPVLKKGDRGASVRELQKLLYDYGAFALACIFGLPEVLIDGDFGDDTEDTVKAFQRQVFLNVDGVVSNITWQALIRKAPISLPVLRRGSKGELVLRVQLRLIISGDYQGTIDGDFGIATEEAVKSLQRRNRSGVDGIIGNATWVELSQIKEAECLP
ncbi:peptidoglycan-binding domain 1 [Calothrix sp. NIES-4071]|nr:peptidoglycan-binding domain 1 [Calothrix sp. NIES-4071]BAZ59211.1 peptidoglycan-binding domain 1 [Calothrix sp. NIES-4105]